MIELNTGLTLYVRTDGSDINNGTCDRPFLTLQAAYDYVCNTYMLCGGKIAIQLGNGIFAGLVTSRGVIGQGDVEDVRIKGNGASYTGLNSGTGQAVIALGSGTMGSAKIAVTDLQVAAPSGYGFLVFGGCALHYGNIEFATCGANHVGLAHNSWVYQTGPCVISGSAMSHISANTKAVYAGHGSQLTFSQPVSFSNGFVSVFGGAAAYPWPMAFINPHVVTGKKFTIGPGSIIDGGGNVNNLVGNQAGTNNSGWYI